MTVVTGDGNTRTAKPYRIGHQGYFNTFLYSLLGIESPFRIVCQDEHGRKTTLKMEGILCRKLSEVSTARDPEALNECQSGVSGRQQNRGADNSSLVSLCGLRS